MRLRFTLLSLLFFSQGYSQITMTLRKSFIDSFKNNLTINANYEVYFAHAKPNPAAKDGDLHFSGYDKKIGLPVVAEIMNAKENKNALDIIHEKEGKGKPDEKIKLSGAWRLWCEHPGDIEAFKQGKMKIEIENTNPSHVFEIHPVTKVDTVDLMHTLHKTTGYTYKIAEDAFSRYSNLRCRISQNAKTISIETNGIGYNYVDFWLELNSSNQQEVSDGLFAYCTIYDSEFDPEDEDHDDLITHKLRVGFIKGSDLYNKVKTMKKGEFLHVAGIPRINLNLVRWRANNGSSRPEVLNWNLPYEMIAVGEID
ncbi:MAG: hypothetical protein E6H07_14900 [Bacteroidetes bacterium]|nr:MAG: hypothetical protein E6H07_14900 [Bacteroidota bacterium]